MRKDIKDMMTRYHDALESISDTRRRINDGLLDDTMREIRSLLDDYNGMAAVVGRSPISIVEDGAIVDMRTDGDVKDAVPVGDDAAPVPVRDDAVPVPAKDDAVPVPVRDECVDMDPENIGFGDDDGVVIGDSEQAVDDASESSDDEYDFLD